MANLSYREEILDVCNYLSHNSVGVLADYLLHLGHPIRFQHRMGLDIEQAEYPSRVLTG